MSWSGLSYGRLKNFDCGWLGIWLVLCYFVVADRLKLAPGWGVSVADDRRSGGNLGLPDGDNVDLRNNFGVGRVRTGRGCKMCR